jgi:hypothetical protein
MKTNVTVRIETTLLREARILAAEEGTSISALLSKRLEQSIQERNRFQKARKRAKARLREGFDLNWAPLQNRDELHER